MGGDDDPPAGDDDPRAGDDDPRSSDAHSEIDPELVNLRRGRFGIGPLLALSIIVFSLYLMVQLRHDLAFSRQAAQPRSIDSVAALFGGDAGNNAFVRMRAAPDRAFATRVAESVAAEGHRIAPVQGSDDRLWLLVGGSVWTDQVAYEEIYTGRVRRLGDMPFAGALRRWVEAQGPAPRHVTADQVKEALIAGGHTLTTPTGDRVAVAPDTPVSVVQQVADRVEIHAARTETHPDAAAWQEALGALDLPLVGAPRDEDDLIVMVVAAPADAVGAALAEARLLSAQVAPVLRRHDTTWAGLTAGPAGLGIDGRSSIDWAELSWVAVTVPRALPDDARILITTDEPGNYWYVLPVYGLLAGFVALFSWGLVLAVRRDWSPPEADVAA